MTTRRKQDPILDQLDEILDAYDGEFVSVLNNRKYITDFKKRIIQWRDKSLKELAEKIKEKEHEMDWGGFVQAVLVEDIDACLKQMVEKK